MRAQTPSISGGSRPWTDTLNRRITGRYSHLATGASTEVAEDLLGFAPMTYMYVNACEPEFGTSIVLFKKSRRLQEGDVAISPFDTGGLALDKIRLSPGVPRALRAALVARFSWSALRYKKAFEAWAKTAFASGSEYIEGVKPSTHLLANIDLRRAQRRAWLWEVRIRKVDYSEPPVHPQVIYLAPGDKMRYLAWFRSQRALRSRQAGKHIREFIRISREVDSRVDAANKHLVRKG